VPVCGGRDGEVIECQEETEQDPREWARVGEWEKVKENESPAAWADPARQDSQALACARSADTRNRINAEFPAWIKNVLSAGLQ
jgi:hypothetical protein